MINIEEDEVEHLLIRIPQIKVIVSVVYIPASTIIPYEKHTNLAIDMYEQNSDYKFIFMGDYNLTGITWSKYSPLVFNSTKSATKDHKKNSDAIKSAYAYMNLLQYIPILNKKGYTLDLLFTDLANIHVIECNDSFLTLDRHHISYNINFNIKIFNTLKPITMP